MAKTFSLISLDHVLELIVLRLLFEYLPLVRACDVCVQCVIADLWCVSVQCVCVMCVHACVCMWSLLVRRDKKKGGCLNLATQLSLCLPAILIST